MLSRLLQIGFKTVGEWHLNDTKVGFTLQAEEDSRNILYAFISGDEVLYIGKTTQPLKKRLQGYKNPGGSQHTNIKGKRFISEILDSGGVVRIYALPDHGLLHFGDFHINLAAGLEDSLISKLKPKWNGCGLKS